MKKLFELVELVAHEHFNDDKHRPCEVLIFMVKNPELYNLDLMKLGFFFGNEVYFRLFKRKEDGLDKFELTTWQNKGNGEIATSLLHWGGTSNTPMTSHNQCMINAVVECADKCKLAKSAKK